MNIDRLQILNFVKKIYFLFLFIILIFGKNIVFFSVPYLPGYIVDQFLLVLVLLLLFVLKKPLNKEVIITVFILMLYFFSGFKERLELEVINNIGQDMILLIYPLILYFILKDWNIEVNYSLVIRACLFLNLIYISDFIIERISLTDFGVKFLNSTFFLNISDFKDEEIFVIALIILQIILSNNIKNPNLKLNLILSGILIGLYATQSKNGLVGLSIFIIIWLLFSKSSFKMKKVLIFIFGFLISFSFTTTNDKNRVYEFSDYLSSNDFSQNIFLHEYRVSSYKCLFKFIFETDNCTVALFSDNVNLNSTDDQYLYIETIKNQTLIKENKFEMNFLNQPEFNELKKLVYSGSNSYKICSENDCNLDNILKSQLFAHRSNICGSTTRWRLNLWEASLSSLSSLELIFGKGTNSIIIREIIEDGELSSRCYKSAYFERPLRNAHNSFVTIIYRFGIIISFLIGFCLLKVFKNLKKNNISEYYVAVLAMTFIDPILDNPMMSIIFWSFTFLLLKQNIFLKSY